MKSHVTTINAPTAPLAFFYFLFLFYSFYNEDRYKNAFEKKKWNGFSMSKQGHCKNAEIKFAGIELSLNSLTIY